MEDSSISTDIVEEEIGLIVTNPLLWQISRTPGHWPFSHPNSRTPRLWKFTQHHRTTRPPLLIFRTENSIWRKKWFLDINHVHGRLSTAKDGLPDIGDKFQAHVDRGGLDNISSFLGRRQGSLDP